MAYKENREIRNPDSNNWEIKTQIHEKSTKEQRNQNQPRPMRNQPKEHTEKSKPKTQTTIQNYRNQIAQISPQTQDLWDEKW